MLSWNSGDNGQTVNIIQQAPVEESKIDDDNTSVPTIETIPDRSASNYKYEDGDDYTDRKPEKRIQSYEDVFNIEYNNVVAETSDIPYRENRKLTVDNEIKILEDKVHFIDSTIQSPISNTVINKIEEE